MKILSKGQYYGTQHLEISYNGILLSKYDYTGERTDWHYHENPYFMYVLQGNMKDCNKKVKTLCPPGSLMFNNWQEPHYGSKHSKLASGFHLEFEKSWLEEKGISLNLWEGSQLIEHPRIHLLFANLYHELLHTDHYSKVSVELLVFQICDMFNSQKDNQDQSQPDWVKGLKELIHYDTSNLSLDYLSEELNVHPVHISRAASKYLTLNLGEYIRQQKVKKSIPLLWDPSVSLTNIAYQLGFTDQSHFNRVFKSYLHVSPGSFRNFIIKARQC